MEFFRNEYTVSGRSNSMYVYVLFNCTQEKIKEHIKKQIEIIDRVSDSFKRRLFLSRYHLLRDYIESREDLIYNHVFFIGDSINSHELSKDNLTVLSKYSHSEISFKYDDHFDLDYLEDLLFNDSPYHVFRVDSNKIDYLHLTKTKKVVISSKESKPLDIMEFINSTILPKSRYILYGLSSKLKDISDVRAYTVINKYIKDEELIEMIDRIDQEDKLIELITDLKMLQDSKHLHKIVLKKDILSKIDQLEKLYIDKSMCDKFKENMIKKGFDINFKIIVIDSKIKSFIEFRERTLDSYGGVVGVAYY